MSDITRRTALGMLLGGAAAGAFALSGRRDAVIVDGLLQAVAEPSTRSVVPASGGTRAPAARPITPKGPVPSGPVGVRRVFVVGDSLTVGATYQGALERRLRRSGYRAVVDGWFGRTTGQGTTILAEREARGELEPLVLVALGTNDVIFGGAPVDFARRIDELMNVVGPDRWVVWMDVVVRINEPADERFGTVLRRKADEWPNLLVGPWAAESDPAHIQADGVHLSDAGYRARARWMVDLLDQVTARPGD